MKAFLSICLFFAIPFSSMAQTKKIALGVGELVYQNNCLACHQADGKGVIGLNPPLSRTKWVLGDKNKLITIVLKGMNETLEIEEEFYQNPMPSHAHLSDQEIADVLTYIRSHFGNRASAISHIEVKSVRKGK